MNDFKLIAGSSNPDLANSISSYLSVPLTERDIEPFSDGEIFVQIKDNVRQQDVFIIQSTNFPVNDNLMELLIMIDAAKRASAKSITAVMPFFGYARQDRKDKPRVPITARLVANMIERAGADRVITMDIHAPQIQGFFDIPCDNLSSSPVMLDRFRGQKNLFVLSPDAGGLKRAQAYSQALKCPMGFAAKKRKDEDTVEVGFIVGNCKGRDVLIVDDMTESLGTLVASAWSAKEAGAKSVRALVTHSVLNKKGLYKVKSDENLLGVFDELIVTNTTRQPDVGRSIVPVTTLDVSTLFAETIRRTYTGESVTELFEIKGI